jgi:hypothetical protein
VPLTDVVGHCGAQLLAAHGAGESKIVHQALNPVAAYRDALTVELAPYLLHFIDAEVVLVHPADLRDQLAVADRAGRGRPGLGSVVRRRGDLQHGAHRLDSPAFPVLVDKSD